jgi:replicative DNA helicase
MTYDDLKAYQSELVLHIDQATQANNTDEVIKLKRKLYQNKISMLDAISKEDKDRSIITARALKQKVDSQPIPPRYETGITMFDYKLKGGFEVGTFIQLSGESGAGKTTFILAILANIARYKNCVLFNYEMGERRISDRLVRLFDCNEQWDNLLIDSHTRHIDRLCDEITLSARDGIKFFMIDSMMKIETDTDNFIEQQVEISHKLSKLCQDKEIIIILINQQSEDALKNNRLSLKGSNSQKYDSDMVFFLTIDKDKRKLICAKNRQDEYLFSLDVSIDDVKPKKEVVVEYETENISMTHI